MKAAKFQAKLLKALQDRRDVAVKTYSLKYKSRTFKFLRLASKSIRPKDKIILINAGLHGEELAGPLTLLRHINKIFDYAHRNGVKLIIYPLSNPSGFEMNERYNIDDEGQVAGNNDFVRYELRRGLFVEDLGSSDRFKRWHWASSKRLKIELPKETTLLQRLIREEPLSQIAACLDLHQDCLSRRARPAAYHYSFGDLSDYKEIVEKIKKILPIYHNRLVGAGQDFPMRSDRNGFIVRHDGTFPDLLYRLGAKYCVTAETMCSATMAKAQKVNLIWIFGLVDLVKK
jgi:hypothetical protein